VGHETGTICDTDTGACGTTCRVDTDCDAGTRCNSNGVCAAANSNNSTDSKDDSGGCSCNAAHADSMAMLLALVALFGCRRRRQA
jgi:MYXO-CTERM domain-containing protein